MLRASATDGEEGCSGIPTSAFTFSSDWFMEGMTAIAEPDISRCLLLFGSCSQVLELDQFPPSGAWASRPFCGLLWAIFPFGSWVGGGRLSSLRLYFR